MWHEIVGRVSIPDDLLVYFALRVGGRTSHEIDHIIAEKHGGNTESDNLAFSCAFCNKYEGSDIASIDPDTGEIVALYYPRHDRWINHFQLRNGQTAVGRVTVRLLQFNHPNRVEERKLLIATGRLNLIADRSG